MGHATVGDVAEVLLLDAEGRQFRVNTELDSHSLDSSNPLCGLLFGSTRLDLGEHARSEFGIHVSSIDSGVFKYGRKHKGVGESMRDVEVTSDGVSESMDGTDGRVGKSHSRVKGAQKHLSSALSVLAVEGCLMDVLGEEGYGFSSKGIGQRVLLVKTGVGLNSVDHGVDSGVDSDFLGDGSGKSSIEDGPVG